MNRRARLTALVLTFAVGAGCAAARTGASWTPPTRPSSALTPAARAASARLSVAIDRGSSAAKADGGPSMPRRTISLRQVVDRALSQTLALALARVAQQRARARRARARGRLAPEISLGAGIRGRYGTHQGSLGVIVGGLNMGRVEPQAALVYRQNIGAQLFEAAATDRLLGEATLRRLAARQRVLLLVTGLYQRLVLAKVAVQIAASLVKDSREFVSVVAARSAAGVGLGSVVERAKAKVAADTQRLIAARAAWEHTSVDLAVVLRLDPARLLDPAERTLTPAGLAQVRDPARAASARPDVQAARRRAAAAQTRTRAAWWRLLAPELQGLVGPVLMTPAFNVGATQAGVDTATRSGARLEYSAFLMWTLSLDGLGRIKQRQAQSRSAALSAQRADEQATGEARLAERALIAATRQVPVAKEGLTAAKAALEISLARFRAGTAIALEVFDAQDTLAQARLNLARSIVAFNSAQLSLLAATGAISRDAVLGR